MTSGVRGGGGGIGIGSEGVNLANFGEKVLMYATTARTSASLT